MDNKTRRSRFETRIQIERDFLTPVNNHFGSIAPLAGMTREAISSWNNRASLNFTPDSIEKISKILLEASIRADLLADNSKDVFEETHRPKRESINELKGILNAELKLLID